MPILSPTKKLPTMGGMPSTPSTLGSPGSQPDWATPKPSTSNPNDLLGIPKPWLDPGGGLDTKVGSGPTAPIPQPSNGGIPQNPLNDLRIPDPSLPKPPTAANNTDVAKGSGVDLGPSVNAGDSPTQMVLNRSPILGGFESPQPAKQNIMVMRDEPIRVGWEAPVPAEPEKPATPTPAPNPLDDLNNTLLGTYKDLADPKGRGPTALDGLDAKLTKTFEDLAGPQDKASPYDNLNSTLLGAFQGLAEGKNPALEQATRTALNAMSGNQLGAEEEARSRAIRMGLPPGSPGYERMVDEARRGATSQGSELLSALAQKGLDDQTKNLDAARSFMDSGRQADDRTRALDLQGINAAGSFLESGRQDASRERTLDLAGVNAAENFLSSRETSADRSRVLGNEEGQAKIRNAQHIVDNPDLYTPGQVGEAKKVLAGGIGASAGGWNAPAQSDSDLALDNLKAIARTRGIPESQIETWARQQFSAMDDATREGFLKAVKENGPAAAPTATAGSAKSSTADDLLAAVTNVSPYGLLGNLYKSFF